MNPPLNKIPDNKHDEQLHPSRPASYFNGDRICNAKNAKQIIEQILDANPGEVEKYRAGKQKVFGFFVGQVMKATRGQANPQLVNELLREKLKI